MSILHINYRPKYIFSFGAEIYISNLIFNDISGGQNSSINNHLQRSCNFFTIVIPFVSYLYFPQVSYSIFTTRPQAKISYSLTRRPHPSNADNNAMNRNTEQPFCPDIQLAVMTMERDHEIRIHLVVSSLLRSIIECNLVNWTMDVSSSAYYLAGAYTTATTGPVLVQCWADVYDVGAASKQHWFNSLCLLGGDTRIDIGTSLDRLEQSCTRIHHQHRPNIGLKLDHHLRRWPSNKPTLSFYIIYAIRINYSLW